MLWNVLHLFSCSILASALILAAPAAVEGGAAEEDQTSMLRLAADSARANAQAINEWIGEAGFVETSKTEGREPQVTRMEVSFVLDRHEGAIRNRVIRHGPHVYVTPDGHRENSDADLTLDLMQKAGTYLSVDKLKNNGAGPDRRILVISPRVSGFHKVSFFDPTSYFSTTGGQTAWEQLDAFLKRPGGLAQNVSINGRKVELTFRSQRSVNRYVFDMNQAGNLTQFFAETDDGANKSIRDIHVDYETVNRTVVPKRWSEELKSRTLAGQSVSLTKEVAFKKNVVNQPIDPREVSIEAMGIKPGDVIRDERTNQTFEYTGKPLSMPTTAPAGAMLDGGDTVELPRAGRTTSATESGTDASTMARFWPGVIAVGVVTVPLLSTWRRRARTSAEAESITSGQVQGFAAATWRWVPRVVGALFILAATTKAADPSGVKQVLIFDGVGDRLIPLALSALVAGELLLGLGLLLGWGGRAMVLVGIAVLGVYSAQLGYLLAFERAPECNCIGNILQFRSAREGHIFGLVRNSIMILALGGTALFAGRQRTSVLRKEEVCLR